jgi:hypothetical protein
MINADSLAYSPVLIDWYFLSQATPFGAAFFLPAQFTHGLPTDAA